MTYLRHAPRHIHHTVADAIEGALDALHWTSTDEAQRPFGATKVVVKRTGGVGRKDAMLEAGQVYVTIGSEWQPQTLELGGPLTEQSFPIFVDILMDEDALAICLAADVRDALLGRLASVPRVLPVIDQSTATPVPGWRIHLENVERLVPDQMFALHWQVVKVTARVEFQES